MSVSRATPTTMPAIVAPAAKATITRTALIAPSVGGRGHGHAELRHGPGHAGGILLGDEVHLPAILRHQPPRDVQSEAGAAQRLRREARLEDPLPRLRRHADALVRDADLRPSAARAEQHLEPGRAGLSRSRRARSRRGSSRVERAAGRQSPRGRPTELEREARTERTQAVSESSTARLTVGPTANGAGGVAAGRRDPRTRPRSRRAGRADRAGAASPRRR